MTWQSVSCPRCRTTVVAWVGVNIQTKYVLVCGKAHCYSTSQSLVNSAHPMSVCKANRRLLAVSWLTESKVEQISLTPLIEYGIWYAADVNNLRFGSASRLNLLSEISRNA